MPRILALVAALLVGAATTARADAGADRARLRAYLAELGGNARALRADGVALPPARDKVVDRPSDGLLVTVEPERLTLAGAPLAASGPPDAVPARRALPALADGLARHKKSREALGALAPAASGPAVVLLDVAARAPYGLVVDVLGVLERADLRDVRLRLARPPLARPFAHSPIDGELAVIVRQPPHDRALALAELAGRVLARCARAKAVLGQLADLTPVQRAGVLLALLGKALEDPACVVDPPSVQNLTVALVGGDPVQSAALRLDAKAKQRVMAGLTATWGEALSAGLVDAALAAGPARPVHFVLSPR